jgi:hypothetical protein
LAVGNGTTQDFDFAAFGNYQTMMSTSSSSAASTSHSFNKILNQFRTLSKSRHAADIDDGVKKLRRLILVEGIPSVVVIFLSKECAS